MALPKTASTNDDVLVVMARAPVPGRVKTRLARHLGDEKACALYRAFLRDIASRFHGRRFSLLWAVTPPGSSLSRWLGPDLRCIDQEGTTLGERMHRCFRRLCDGRRRVVMIGADVPHLSDAAIDAAFRPPDDTDLVLAPTEDGGYGLVGLCRPHDVFTAVPMGTPEVFARTREEAARLGLRVHVLPRMFDIDEPEDLRRLADLIRRHEVDLPATAGELGL